MRRLLAVLILLSASAFAQTTCINCPGNAYGTGGLGTVNVLLKGNGSGQAQDSAITDNVNVTITGESLLFSADNLKDIGAVGATRPRTGYFGTSVITPLVNATTGFQVAGAAANGSVLVGDGTNFVGKVLQVDKQDAGGEINGNSGDQTVFTYTMPANTLASGKCLLVRYFFTHTTGSTSTTYKLFFGGTTVVSAASTSANVGILGMMVCNNAGSTTAQWAEPTSTIIGNAAISQVASAPAETTTSGTIIIKGTFNVASGDKVTGKGWSVELIP